LGNLRGISDPLETHGLIMDASAVCRQRVGESELAPAITRNVMPEMPSHWQTLGTVKPACEGC